MKEAHRNEFGEFGNKVGDWSDVYDLDYNNEDLVNDQINILKYWAGLGTDGFRCDVAPLVPINFWLKARKEIRKINNDFIWLSESVEPSFIAGMRKRGYAALSHSEIYNAFDITYDYDVFDYFMEYLKGEIKLKNYVEKLTQQEYENLIKRLSEIKKDKIMAYGSYEIKADDTRDIVVIKYELDSLRQTAVFNFTGFKTEVNLFIADGLYKDILNDKEINVINHRLLVGEKPIIIKYEI